MDTRQAEELLSKYLSCMDGKDCELDFCSECKYNVPDNQLYNALVCAVDILHEINNK